MEQGAGHQGQLYNGNAVDEANLRNNDGGLSFDRTHIFNAIYSYDEGFPVKEARVLRIL